MSYCPDSEVRHAWISRLTNFRIDEDTSKALFSVWFVVPKFAPGMIHSMADFGTTTPERFHPR
jgi:hypothetical protein